MPSGRAPYGARGLKFEAPVQGTQGDGRAPYGARGLKSHSPSFCVFCIIWSRPVWGAWVEIDLSELTRALSDVPSRPVWGAWVEMCQVLGVRRHGAVAPRMGRVG